MKRVFLPIPIRKNHSSNRANFTGIQFRGFKLIEFKIAGIISKWIRKFGFTYIIFTQTFI